MIIRPEFLNSEQREELEQIVRRPSEVHGVARRANAILLLDDGKSCAEISEYLYLDDDTIRQWYKRYLSGGWDELETFDWKGGTSHLSAQQETELLTWLSSRVCRDTNEISDHILRTCNVQFSRSGCIALMHRLGFEYKKPKKVPAVADEEEQREFIETYEKLLNHLPEDEIVYFGDAVHPDHQVRPAHGWFHKDDRPAVLTSSGRKRINIHGAVCLENFDTPFMEVEKVDADSTIHLFEKLEAINRDKKTIHVVLDNAKYHHAVKVQEWLSRPGCKIKIIWLPSYAPHLNSIERLWGVMHKYVTHNKFYKTYKAFAEAILHFLRETIPKEWKDFRDTVTDNFRIISTNGCKIIG